MKEEPSIQNKIETPTPIKGNIEFKDVTFTYEDTDITALKDVSFTIKAGQTVAILGKTGSGKSTILDLVARLYDATSGEVLIDGVPAQKSTLIA